MSEQNETQQIGEHLEELLDWSRFYLEGVCLLPISIIGIIGKKQAIKIHSGTLLTILSLCPFKGLMMAKNRFRVTKKVIRTDPTRPMCVVLN